MGFLGGEWLSRAHHACVQASYRMACCSSPKGRARRENAWEGSAKLLHTEDASPMEKVSFQRQRRTARIAKATYGANAPNEDRHTVAVGTECLFAGVWDGHGGTDLCADYLDREFVTTFRDELNFRGDPSAAFGAAFEQLDQRFIGDAEKEGNLVRMCCGSWYAPPPATPPPHDLSTPTQSVVSGIATPAVFLCGDLTLR